jgi:hypothetical protein
MSRFRYQPERDGISDGIVAPTMRSAAMPLTDAKC